MSGPLKIPSHIFALLICGNISCRCQRLLSSSSWLLSHTFYHLKPGVIWRQMCILWILKWVICDVLLGKKKAVALRPFFHSMMTVLCVTLPVALVIYEASVLYNQAACLLE